MNPNSDGLDRAPWWIAAILRGGVSLTFAAVLLWYLITNVSATLATLSAAQQGVTSNQTLIIANQGRLIQLLQNTTDQNRRLLAVTVIMCQAVSKTQQERETCVLNATISQSPR